MWYMHDGPEGWGWIGMGLMMLLIWLPIILILVWALRPSVAGRDERRGSDATELDAVEIARRAYARGDLDRERYLQVVSDLKDGGG